MNNLSGFEEIWAADFEFRAPPGERQEEVHCLVAREYRSGRLIRQWYDEFGSAPPFRTDSGALFVAYYASAELGCFKALDWPRPANIIDLFAEFRVLTNGLNTPGGHGLLGALTYFGLPGIAALEKDLGRELAIRGGPFTAAEKLHLLDYCQSDTDALCHLLPMMAPDIDVPRALLRGRYMAAAAAIEWNGVPIDQIALDRLRNGWDGIKERLVAEIDANYGVYDGTTFKLARFEQYLAREGIPWPRLPSGQLDLEDDTFKDMARYEPRIAPLRELRASLSQLRLNDLAVGKDGRNRVILSAFRSRTGATSPAAASTSSAGAYGCGI
jgi:hypothetical protein